MRRIVTAAAIASAILTGGCNTFRGVKQDVSSLKEVVPSGSSQVRADAPTPAPDSAAAATP
jgi:predicted small secreted protein